MTDRELLELAAKAAGVKYEKHYESEDGSLYIVHGQRDAELWNPLTDDGDALRLAVKLKIEISFENQRIEATSFVDLDGCAYVFDPSLYENVGTDSYAATRRAIVRAAAEIWKTK